MRRYEAAAVGSGGFGSGGFGSGGFGSGGPASADGWPAHIRARLFDQRIVLLAGDLDSPAANQAAVELMTLDATGDGPVQLRVTSGAGDVDAALSVMDVVDLLGVPVHATCLGLVGGPALGVVAACARRTATPHSRFHLFEPPLRRDGHADQLERFAAIRTERWQTYCSRMAGLLAVPEARLREDLVSGRFLSALEALAYGLIDTITGGRAEVRRLPGPGLGFGSPR